MIKAPVISEAYLRFRIQLDLVTTPDPIAYTDWIREHQEQLRADFMQSGEDDSAVWVRMQYLAATTGASQEPLPT